MLLTILVLNLVLLSLTDAGLADAKSSPKLGLEDGLGSLVEKLESRLRDMETKMQEMEESLRKEIASKVYNSNALTNPSLRENPIVLISAWRDSEIRSPQTVTFDSFLANYINDGGDGVLDLDSGVFTCFNPGHYQVSFSAHAVVGPNYDNPRLALFKNGLQLPESNWYFYGGSALMGVDGSHILVRNLFLEIFA